MLKQFVSGSETRRTRLHDELNNRVPLSRLVRNGPQAMGSGILRLIAGYRANRPWISYDAQKLLSHFLTPHRRVLEFGSGMSTVWYAHHAGEVVSIEDNEAWFHQVEQIIHDHQAENIRYRFARTADQYSVPTKDETGPGFDLIMIDGSFRDSCVERSCHLLKPGGIIYLDNSDKSKCPISGNIPRARKILEEFAFRHDGVLRYFTDFAPTQLFVQQGLLVQIAR